MSEVQAPATVEREITVYATRGNTMKKLTTSVTTWGELKPLVRNAGFDLSSLLAAENITKNDLVNDQAILPTGPFRLFLRPKQTKSGAPDRKECFAIIKAHLVSFPQDKPKFSIDGKNVTQLGTPVVQGLVAKYCQKSTKEEAPAPKNVATEKATKAKPEVVEAVKEVVKNVGESKKATQSEAPLTAVERIEKATELLSAFEGYDSYKKVQKHLNNLLVEVDPSKTPPVKEETEEESVAREAREMMGGY
jgi:hypothetical protein